MEGNYDEKKGKNKEEKIEREIPASEEWKYKYETKTQKRMKERRMNES